MSEAAHRAQADGRRTGHCAIASVPSSRRRSRPRTGSAWLLCGPQALSVLQPRGCGGGGVPFAKALGPPFPFPRRNGSGSPRTSPRGCCRSPHALSPLGQGDHGAALRIAARRGHQAIDAERVLRGPRRGPGPRDEQAHARRAAALRQRGERKVVPYSAVYYDASGRAWVYVNPRAHGSNASVSRSSGSPAMFAVLWMVPRSAPRW